jgi:hypothetical protein
LADPKAAIPLELGIQLKAANPVPMTLKPRRKPAADS